jgi:hypothetical protein
MNTCRKPGNTHEFRVYMTEENYLGKKGVAACTCGWIAFHKDGTLPGGFYNVYYSAYTWSHKHRGLGYS